ncbi:MAG: YitT family protein [Firmicutes bacterium]|nr:YitT family protein [Bacillota bacterium]
MKNKKIINFIKEFLLILLLGFFVAVSYYCFVTPNNFAPGGIYGLSSMIQNKTVGLWGLKNGIPWAVPVLIFSIPIVIVSFIVLSKKSAVVIMLVALSCSGFDILLELVRFPQYLANGDPILCLFAAAIGGILAGVAFAITIKFFGTADGTIAIAAIIKKKRPALNIPWATFAFDAVVVGVSFFVYWNDYTASVANEPIGAKIVAASMPVVYSIVNMFFVSRFWDLLLKGFSAAYKFEIVCTPGEAEKISQILMEQLGRGVTVAEAEGMYTRSPKSLIICVIPKKQITNFKRILKDFPDAFGYVVPANEVMGNFY